MVLATRCLAADAPPEIVPYIKAQTPYGSATVTRMMIRVYDATLWTDAKPWSMHAPFALTLRYGFHFSSQSLVERTLEEMQHVDHVPQQTQQALKLQLARVFPDVRSGDTITALFLPGKKTLFFHNSKPTGTIVGEEFGKVFFDIWLSPNTSEPDARHQLLAEK
jgi:hypothetical protein